MLAAEAYKIRLERGLSFKTTQGNVLTWTPPLIVTMAQMGQALDILEDCLRAQAPEED